MKPLSFDDASYIRSIFDSNPPIFSEFTFSNLMMWCEERPTYYQEIEGSVQFFVEDPNLIAFGPPFGSLSQHEVLPKLEVTKVVRTSLPETTVPGWTFSPSPDDADYVYLVSDLINYPGHKYHRKRQQMNGCLERYKCLYEPLTAELIQECLDLQTRIIKTTSPNKGQMKEHRAAKFLMTHFSRFHSFGGVIRVDGQVEAVMIASQLNETTAVAHIEKINPKIHGISALLHNWFAKKTLQHYLYFNVEQDLGISGIRESKQRFIPNHMVVKYTGHKL